MLPSSHDSDEVTQLPKFHGRAQAAAARVRAARLRDAGFIAWRLKLREGQRIDDDR